MFYWLKRSSYTRIVILGALTLALSACFGKPAFMVQPTEPPPAANNPSQANPASQHITESHSPQAAVVDVSYTLVTGVSGAQLVYIGQGGEIDGVVNPELTASPGDTVEIILINGDGAEHDIAVPEVNAHSEHIVGRNSVLDLQWQGAWAVYPRAGRRYGRGASQERRRQHDDPLGRLPRRDRPRRRRGSHPDHARR
jgi:hypothetical protein